MEKGNPGFPIKAKNVEICRFLAASIVFFFDTHIFPVIKITHNIFLYRKMRQFYSNKYV